jgi:hypothetical protein
MVIRRKLVYKDSCKVEWVIVDASGQPVFINHKLAISKGKAELSEKTIPPGKASTFIGEV